LAKSSYGRLTLQLYYKNEKKNPLKWDNLALIAEISPNNENLEIINCHNWRKNWLNCIKEDCHFEQLHHKNEKQIQLEMG
jgi:hypothetical protein